MRWFHYGICSLAALAFLSTPVLSQSRTERERQKEQQQQQQREQQRQKEQQQQKEKEQQAQQGQKGEEQRLSLRLQKNKEFSYQVTDSTMAQGGQQGQELTYNLKVTDTSGGMNTCELTISQGQQGQQSQQGQQPPAQAQAQGQTQGQQFDVKVGQDGEVVSVVPKQAQGQQAQGQQQMNTEKIKSHLEAILGSGLHRFPLEKGKAFHLTSKKFVRHEDRPETQEQGTGQEQQQAQQTPWSDPLRHLAARFEQMTKEGGKDVAQFTVVVPPASQAPGTTPPGVRPIRFQGQQGQPAQQSQGRNLGEGQESARPFDAKDWKSVGKATYNTEDGLCMKLETEGEVAVTQDASRPATPTKFKFSVQRNEGQQQQKQQQQPQQPQPKR